MHITVQDVLAVGVVLNLIASLLARFHAKKAAAGVQAIAQTVQKDAPEIADVATGVVNVTTDLSK